MQNGDEYAHAHTFVAMRVVSFNLLAHAYTKFNAVLHKQTDTREESAEQKHTRRARNAALIATLRPEVLLLQEHDLDVRVEGYARGVRALVDGRTEGCSVLLADWSPLAVEASFTVDLGDSKSGAAAKVGGTWFVSSHLKGGAGSDDAKVRQTRCLLHTLDAMDDPRAPAVWAGDMNETEPGRVLQPPAAEHGFQLVPSVGPTGLTSGAMVTALELDHVFVRHLGTTPRQTVPVPPVEGGPWAPTSTQGSDHVPVVLTI